MTISKTQTEYINDLIAMWVEETDAKSAARILYEVDRTRERTPEEQALIGKVYQQIQDYLLQGKPVERTSS